MEHDGGNPCGRSAVLWYPVGLLRMLGSVPWPWVAECTQDLVNSFVLTSAPFRLYGCTLHPSVMVAAGHGYLW